MNRILRRTLALLIALPLLVITAPVPAKTELVPPTVAVLYFDYTGKNPELSVLRKGLAQMLISDLQSPSSNVVIVERERLEDVLKELKLSHSKKFDSKTAAKLGKLMGARYIVLGSFFDLFGQLRVDSRMIDVQTGVVLGSVGKRGRSDDFFSLEQELVAGLRAIFKDKARPVKAAPHKRRPRYRPRRRPKPAKKPTPPNKKATAPKLDHTVVIQYSKALDAKDQGDTTTAIKGLRAVVAKQPNFAVAAMDLNALVQ